MAILTADPSGNRPKPWVIPTEISMTLVASVRQQWLANPRRDLLAGTVVALARAPVPADPWVATMPRPTAATSPPKPPVPWVQTRNPPLSASAKPRQLQQLTVPRPSDRS